jgi:hypothetical protein
MQNPDQQPTAQPTRAGVDLVVVEGVDDTAELKCAECGALLEDIEVTVGTTLSELLKARDEHRCCPE